VDTPRPRLPKVLAPSSLRDISVADLGEEHTSMLGEVLKELEFPEAEISEDKNLSFLSELWLSEKIKGKGANREAMAKIEEIAISANVGPFSPRVYPSPKDGGGGGATPSHGTTRNAFKRLGGRISHIMTRHRQKAKDEESGKKTESTSVTLGYQADKWSIERIALDGIQNHLPSDSKGSRVGISYLVGGEWIDWKDYKSGSIDAIKFSDDGKGYSSELLGVFHSTKKEDKEAVGYFGEGLKMLSAACLREGLNLELRSRDWSAKPIARQRTIDGHKVEQLVFEISDEPHKRGSETIFTNPPEKFTEYVSNLESKVLLLRQGYKPLYSNNNGAVVDRKGDIFARGVYISGSENLFFSYDFDIIPNRDRDNVSERQLQDNVRYLWQQCSDAKALSMIFGAYEQDPARFLKSSEFSIIKRNSNFDRDVWSRAFIAHYGPKAVLVTSPGISSIVESAGFKPIKIAAEFALRLKELGVITDFDVLGGGEDLLYLGEKFEAGKITKEIMPTDLSLDYRAKAWGVTRIFLDSLSNHLPKDSGANSVKVEYLVEMGSGNEVLQWSPRRGYEKVFAIRITDDGRGYAPERLRILNSDKASEAVGQFGEGLKMLSAACLREGVRMKVSSRDWFAMPVKSSAGVEGKNIEMLAFQLVRGADKRVGSATLFYQPDNQLVRLFDNKSLYFLHFAEPETMDVLHTSPRGRIFTRQGDNSSLKHTYVKGVYVCDNTIQTRTLFNYDIDTDRVFPDRDNIDFKIFKQEIAALLGSCENKEIIRTILSEAERFEFFVEKDIPIQLENDRVKEAWLSSFNSVFGKNGVLDSKNPSANYDAEHRGHRVVYLNDNLMNTLQQAGVKTAFDVALQNYETDNVPLGQLTELERNNLALLKTVDEILGTNYSGSVLIYTNARNEHGESSPVPAFFNGNVNIRRDQLENIFRLVDCYKHEVGHGVTHASDPADAFRAYFENISTAYIVRDLQMRGEKIAFPDRPLNYTDEIKKLQAEQVRYAAMEHRLKESVERTAEERKKLEGKFYDRINELEEKNRQLETQLRIEENKRWYQRVFRKRK
jgi:hypothetical protein